MGTYLIKNVDVCVADSIYIKGEKALVAQNDIDENTVLKGNEFFPLVIEKRNLLR